MNMIEALEVSNKVADRQREVINTYPANPDIYFVAM